MVSLCWVTMLFYQQEASYQEKLHGCLCFQLQRQAQKQDMRVNVLHATF
jgi:hypothetical protein